MMLACFPNTSVNSLSTVLPKPHCSKAKWSSQTLTRLYQSALLCTVVLCNRAPCNIIRKKRGVGAGWLGEVFCGGGRGDGRERRRVGGLSGELNFVNGVFLRASHSALKAKPPGWGLWSAGIRHAQSVPLLKSPSESYLFEQPFLNLFLYQLVGCDLAKCFGNRRQRWMVKRRRFPLALFFCSLADFHTYTHTHTPYLSPCALAIHLGSASD